MRKDRRRNALLQGQDEDPMQSVANLFDVAMVFAVALMVALVTLVNSVFSCKFSGKFLSL
jgi:hypothetical protein